MFRLQNSAFLFAPFLFRPMYIRYSVSNCQPHHIGIPESGFLFHRRCLRSILRSYRYLCYYGHMLGNLFPMQFVRDLFIQNPVAVHTIPIGWPVSNNRIVYCIKEELSSAQSLGMAKNRI